MKQHSKAPQGPRGAFLLLPERRRAPLGFLRLRNLANLGSPEVSLRNPTADSIRDESEPRPPVGVAHFRVAVRLKPRLVAPA